MPTLYEILSVAPDAGSIEINTRLGSRNLKRGNARQFEGWENENTSGAALPLASLRSSNFLKRVGKVADTTATNVNFSNPVSQNPKSRPGLQFSESMKVSLSEILLKPGRRQRYDVYMKSYKGSSTLEAELQGFRTFEDQVQQLEGENVDEDEDEEIFVMELESSSLDLIALLKTKGQESLSNSEILKAFGQLKQLDKFLTYCAVFNKSIVGMAEFILELSTTVEKKVVMKTQQEAKAIFHSEVNQALVSISLESGSQKEIITWLGTVLDPHFKFEQLGQFMARRGSDSGISYGTTFATPRVLRAGSQPDLTRYNP